VRMVRTVGTRDCGLIDARNILCDFLLLQALLFVIPLHESTNTAL
jgi:hypothetical protein